MVKGILGGGSTLVLLIAGATFGAGIAHAASLKQAVVQALDTNPVVRSAAENRKAIDQELRQARGTYLPQVDLTASRGEEITNDTTTRAREGKGNSTTLPARDGLCR